MFVVATVRLNPTPEVAARFAATADAFHRACRFASGVAVERGVYNAQKLQKLVYADLKKTFGLGAQAACLCVRVVADAHKVGVRDQVRNFGDHTAVPFDSRSYAIDTNKGTASLWTTNGRVNGVSYTAGGPHVERLNGIRKQADLMFVRGQWMLAVIVEVAEPETVTPTDFLGVDFGVANIAADSDGELYSGKSVKAVRHRHRRLRSKLQRKGTRSARRRLRKLSGQERRYATWVNHGISKRIVRRATGTGRGISLEDLTRIRDRVTARKAQRAVLHSWSFFQLRSFIAYKARLAGVFVTFVDPRNTSRTCPACGHIDKENRKTQSVFRCVACNHSGAADLIAAENIRRAAVNRPHVSGTPHN